MLSTMKPNLSPETVLSMMTPSTCRQCLLEWGYQRMVQKPLFSSLGLLTTCKRAAPTASGIDAAEPSSQQPDNKSSFSPEEDLLRMLQRQPQTTATSSIASGAGLENAFSSILTGSDRTLFTASKDRSSVSHTSVPS